VAPPQDTAAFFTAAKRQKQIVCKLAAENPTVFNEYVLMDERTGKRIVQAPMHDQWQELISSYHHLVLWAHVDAGKTNQLSIGRVLWELGRNPNMRVVIVSKTSHLAKKIVRSCGQYIEKSEALHEVFPGLLPANDAALPWTSYSLTVERTVMAKDASIQACGNYGNIQGSRIDLLILDDILDFENTRTSTPRQHLWDWLRGTLFNRLTEHARVVFIANAFHPDDAAHRLAREPRFMSFRFPVINPQGQLTWPTHWPHSRINEQRDLLGPLEFSRALLCQARDDESARFKREFIDGCKAQGAGLSFVSSAADLYAELGLTEDGQEECADASVRYLDDDFTTPANGPVRFYTGVDLAVSRHDHADLTCLFTIAVLPNFKRRICEIRSGRWSAPEILEKIRDTYTRFGSLFIVENNAAQQYIVDMLAERSPVPVKAFTTGKQKAHPEFGVEGLATEFSNKRWIIPSTKGGGAGAHREIDEWMIELLSFDPSAHPGDRLMASWFAREGARAEELQLAGGSGSVTARVIG
jgi:hypothetical protein